MAGAQQREEVEAALRGGGTEPGEVRQIILFDGRPTCRYDGIRPHSASVLQQDRKSVNIHANWGFVWGISELYGKRPGAI